MKRLETIAIVNGLLWMKKSQVLPQQLLPLLQATVMLPASICDEIKESLH